MIDTSGKGGSTKEADDKPKINPGTGKTAKCRHASTQKCIHCMSAAVENNGEDKKDGEAEAN